MINYQSTPDFYNDYISHHGILGMHWGKRNGPPYPLGAGDHSVSEKKAGWRKSLSAGNSEKKTDSKSDVGYNAHTRTVQKKQWAEKANKTPKLENMKVDEDGFVEAPVKVPHKWGNIEVEFPNTDISMGKKEKLTQKDIDSDYERVNSFINDFNNNPKVLNDIKEAIYKQYGNNTWDEESHSKQDFFNKLDSINSLGFDAWHNDNNRGKKAPITSMMYFNDGGMYYYHVFSVEYDVDNKKVRYISLEG